MGSQGVVTFFFIHTKNDNDFVPSYSDEFLNRSDTSSRELREQDHSLDVIILQLHRL